MLAFFVPICYLLSYFTLFYFYFFIHPFLFLFLFLFLSYHYFIKAMRELSSPLSSLLFEFCSSSLPFFISISIFVFNCHLLLIFLLYIFTIFTFNFLFLNSYSTSTPQHFYVFPILLVVRVVNNGKIHHAKNIEYLKRVSDYYCYDFQEFYFLNEYFIFKYLFTLCTLTTYVS